MPLEPVLAALAAFTLAFVCLRAAEWLFHRSRHTPDYSPHWGSWLFAVLTALFVLLDQLGR